MNNHVSRFLSAVILTACLLWSTTPVDASQSTLSPDQLEKGMTGYGVTVFEGTKRETFPVTVKGVLKNVMPDQDIVLIKANTELLNHTMIMSGMSGSPIYINDHLIGALAYSWPFEKEPIAGVTPIRNIKNARRQGPIQTGKGGPETIRTPIVTSGLNAAVKQDLSSQFSERGLTPKFITGGQSGASDSPPAEPVPSKLRPGAAVGVQLMRGDLSMTAIGTVTHVEGNTVFAFGHPFLGAGNVEFPMTTANVHTYMPSYESSFKLASPAQTVGVVTQDRKAAVVGQTGAEPDLLPVDINLASPDQNFDTSYHVKLIRNRSMTPGLLNSALSNFAGNKLEQRGINWVKTSVNATLPDHPDVTFQRTRLIKGSYSAWTFLPLLKLWSNPFIDFEPERVTVEMTLHHGRESAKIEDVWTNKSPEPGDKFTVYTKINPFREPPVVRKTTVKIPDNVNGRGIRISAIPAPQLKQLEPQPGNFTQLIANLNNQRNPRNLAIVVEIPEPSMEVGGHRMDHIPRSIAGTYRKEPGNRSNQKASVIRDVQTTDWILGGNASIQRHLNQP